MKTSFGKIAVAAVAILALASFAMAPLAEAAGRGGGGGGGHHAGGGGGGGGARNAGGGGRQNVKVNNNRADVRTKNVRNTSVNNVNIDRNVNVNVDRGGCCNGGWDNNYHPVATAVAVTAAVGVTSAIVGSMVRTVPAGCVPVNYGGMIYQQCGSAWYQPQGSQYVVINPPY